MFASPASTTVRTSNGSMSSWSEWMRPDVYWASRIARGPNRVPDRWLTASSNGAPMIATSTPRRRSSAGIGDPRQLHEDDRADVGRQVEVAVRLELAVPAVARRAKSAMRASGRGGARPRGPPETGAAGDRPRSGDPSRWGRRRFESVVQRGAPRPMVAPGSTRPDAGLGRARRTASVGAERAPGRLDERRIGEQVVRGLGHERRGQQRRLVGARRRRRVAERDRVAGRALGRRSRGRGGWSGRPS